MHLATKGMALSLSVLTYVFFVAGQTVLGQTADNPNPATTVSEKVDAGKSEITGSETQPEIWLHLVGGRRLQVDEVNQTKEGVWYTRNNVTTFLEASRVVKIERGDELQKNSPREVSSRKWNLSSSAKVEGFFWSRFKRPLPLTAFGQSALHTRWGLDHRHGIDVGLHPDSLEGKELIKFLTQEEIPFLAFRGSIPGVATGPHIHIGNGSPKFRSR